MTRVAFYIDGFNLYHAIDELNKDHLKWVNLSVLANSFLANGESISRIVYFSAYTVWNREKQIRHKLYVKSLEYAGVECKISKFEPVRKWCRLHNRYCKFYEEKMTDVSFALEVLNDAATEGYEKIYLVTSDSDQIPTVNKIKSRFPKIRVNLAAPPGRLRRARDLGSTVHKRQEISLGRLGTSLFPRNVKNDDGKLIAAAPALYKPPHGWRDAP